MIGTSGEVIDQADSFQVQRSTEQVFANSTSRPPATADPTESKGFASLDSEPNENPEPFDLDRSDSRQRTPIAPGPTVNEVSIQTVSTGSRPGVDGSSVQKASDVVAESSVRFVITGVHPGSGPVKVAVYLDKQKFAALENANQSLQLPSGQSTLEVTVPISGRFAAAVYQDINADGQLNRGRFSVPTEPFAFSNNAMGVRGPPSFDQAAVVVPPSSEAPFLVHIGLRQPNENRTTNQK
jgi:uncharacterized protein (DUF2141 family)